VLPSSPVITLDASAMAIPFKLRPTRQIPPSCSTVYPPFRPSLPVNRNPAVVDDLAAHRHNRGLSRDAHHRTNRPHRPSGRIRRRPEIIQRVRRQPVVVGEATSPFADKSGTPETSKTPMLYSTVVVSYSPSHATSCPLRSSPKYSL
jgi:hypothetical protein